MDEHYQQIFMARWSDVQQEVHATAKSKGWWDVDPGDADRVVNIHEEVSEAWSGLRHGNPPSEHIPEFSAVEEEYADIIIRIMDHAEKRGWDVPSAMFAKMEFNKTRPYKHGKKF